MAIRVSNAAVVLEYRFDSPDHISSVALGIEYENDNYIYVSSITLETEYRIHNWFRLSSIALMVEYIDPTIVSLSPGNLSISGIDTALGAIAFPLDGLNYRVLHKTWKPALMPLVSSRLLQSGGLDATWFATPQYIFTGEIVAPVTPETDYGSIDDLRTTLAKRQKLGLVDNYGEEYHVVFMGPNSERGLSQKWDDVNNVFYVTVQLKGIKGTLAELT
jgi:hypothetical protein